MRRRLGKRALAACVGLVVALVLAEAGVRALTWMKDRRRAEDWTAMARQAIEREPGMDATLGHVIRPSEYHDVIYQLIPGLDVSYMNGRLITNSAGFRGPETEVEKPDGVFRILCLGDSVMFGSGVANGEEFVRVAESELNGRELSRRVEIVNTSVPGYNTAIQVALLENVGLAYEPDMLWIDFVGNDLSLPNMIPGETRNPLALDRSFLWEWARLQIWGGQNRYEALVNAPTHDGAFEFDPERVPREYRHLVGVEGHRDAMRRLAELARQRDLPVLVTAHRGTQPYLHEVCEELGFPLVRGDPRVRDWMEANGVEVYRGSVLTVSEEDAHPSALQHRLLGELYAEAILELGVLK